MKKITKLNLFLTLLLGALTTTFTYNTSTFAVNENVQNNSQNFKNSIYENKSQEIKHDLDINFKIPQIFIEVEFPEGANLKYFTQQGINNFFPLRKYLEKDGKVALLFSTDGEIDEKLRQANIKYLNNLDLTSILSKNYDFNTSELTTYVSHYNQFLNLFSFYYQQDSQDLRNKIPVYELVKQLLFCLDFRIFDTSKGFLKFLKDGGKVRIVVGSPFYFEYAGQPNVEILSGRSLDTDYPESYSTLLVINAQEERRFEEKYFSQLCLTKDGLHFSQMYPPKFI